MQTIATLFALFGTTLLIACAPVARTAPQPAPVAQEEPRLGFAGFRPLTGL